MGGVILVVLGPFVEFGCNMNERNLKRTSHATSLSSSKFQSEVKNIFQMMFIT